MGQITIRELENMDFLKKYQRIFCRICLMKVKLFHIRKRK